MHSPSPETLAVNKESSKLFWRTVWTMPPHLRCVITHLYVCNRSFEEAAQLMGTTCAAIEIIHTKALAELRSRIRIWQ